MADDFDLQHSDDEGQVPAVHNKLLGAVSHLYEKKRVKAPTRKEPSLEVSEFHLSQPDKKQGRIKVTELAKVLNKRAVHAEIGHKLKAARKRARTLPRPLEKFHADQITRAAGYELAKRQLNRWDAVVYQHKVAEQLQFPLKNETIKVHQETTDVSKLFRKPTELEIKLAEMLKEPDPTKPQKEVEENKSVDKEEDYPLTLAEVIEKRKMMAKLRAQQSYKQSKAARHSKIKSKKFHQIQRRARVKEQLKEFEELQKKDPEAALRKLEELERTRAEERVTLRHRSTGQWAKNLAVRAKFDKEARIALSEQLAKSRELTVKLAQDKDSESEKEEEGEDRELGPEGKEEDPSNPWVMKSSKEMQDFVSGYRKFWESKEQQKQEVKTDDTAVKVKDSSDELSQSINKVVSEKSEGSQNSTSVDVNEGDRVKEDEMSPNNKEVKIVSTKKVSTSQLHLAGNKSDDKTNLNCDSTSSPERDSVDCDDITVSVTRNSICKNVFDVSSSSLNKENVGNNTLGKMVKGSLNKANLSIGQDVGVFEVSNGCEKSANKIKNNMNSSFKISTTPISKTNIKKRNSVEPRKSLETNSDMNNRTGSWSVTKVSQSKNSNNKVKNKSLEVNLAKSPTGKFIVSESVSKNKKNRIVGKSEKKKSIDELFEEVEDKLQDKIREKCEKIKETLAAKRKNEVDSGVESDTEELPSLELKRRKITAEIDEELLEQLSSANGSKVNKNIERTLATATSDQVKSTDDIDPNKFLKVTPRHLVNKLPDMVTEGEDAVDDEETTAEDRHLTISEAFAEDDVVDQFQKEKEVEAKKSVVGDVDLTLPGWGSWGGHNIKPTNRRKRKKFIIKFPKAVPRRDTNRGNVIINEDADKPIKEHQVSDVPYPFTSVKEYEASIRAPLGATWVPQTANAKLTAPGLVTRMGAVIAPMDNSQLVNKDKTNVPPSNKAKKNKIRSVANKK